MQREYHINLVMRKKLSNLLKNKKELVQKANACGFYSLVKTNERLAFRNLFTFLKLNLNSKVDRRHGKARLKKILLNDKNIVSSSTNSYNVIIISNIILFRVQRKLNHKFFDLKINCFNFKRIIFQFS